MACNSEMIDQFKTQLEGVVAKIRELDTEINTKKEEYFRLQGAIEALQMADKEGHGEVGEDTTNRGVAPETIAPPAPTNSTASVIQ